MLPYINISSCGFLFQLMFFLSSEINTNIFDESINNNNNNNDDNVYNNNNILILKQWINYGIIAVIKAIKGI